ncbi:MAG: biopolymer transporter ExbD [Planctomycetota bacterium]
MKLRMEEEEGLGINLTPMIDVVFLLIIFFMVTTTFIQLEKEMSIELPEAQSGESAGEGAKEIIVNVLAEGRIVVNQQDVSADGLLDLLLSAHERNPEVEVVIRSDGDATAKTLIGVVLDKCQAADIHNIAFNVRDPR